MMQYIISYYDYCLTNGVGYIHLNNKPVQILAVNFAKSGRNDVKPCTNKPNQTKPVHAAIPWRLLVWAK